MGWFNKKFEDGSRTVLLMYQDSAGRRTKFLIGGVALLVLLAGGGYALTRYMGTKATEQVGTSWNALNGCLLGDPLKPGEKPSMRFRAIQLSAMTQADVSRVAAGTEPWPDRCAKHALELHEALVAASRTQEGSADLGSWAEKLATSLHTDAAFQQDLSDVIDQTWAAAAKEGLSATKLATMPAPPPAPAAPLTIDSFAGGKPIVKSATDLKALGLELDPASAVRFLFEDKDGPDRYLLCSIPGTDNRGSCGTLPAAVLASPVGLQLLGTADDDSDVLVFTGNRGSEGVFRSGSGDRIGAATCLGGYAAKDGFSALLAYDEAARRLELIRKTGTSPAQTLPVTTDLKLADPQRDAALLWNHMVYRGTNSYNETWLGAIDVRGSAAGPGAPSQIGLLAEPGPAQPEADSPVEITGCKSSGLTVARVRGRQSEFLTFLVGDRWTKPVQVVGYGGTLNCRKAEASITRVDIPRSEGMLKTVITQHRCTPAACSTESVSLEDMLKGELLLAPVASVLAAELDGKLLVVWTGGDRGGIRMRLAPIKDIAKTPDQIFFDDLVKDGQVQKTSTVSDMRLVSREKYAVLFMSTQAGTFAVRIDRDGAAGLVAMSRE